MITAAYILLGAAIASAAHGAETLSIRDSDAICESFFRHLFDNNGSGQQRKAGAFFLSIGKTEGDPSKAFLKRFAKEVPPVKGISESNMNSGGVVDKRTGSRGVLFFIRSIDRVSSDEVHVYGGWRSGNMASQSGAWRIVRKKRRWVVDGPIGQHEVS